MRFLAVAILFTTVVGPMYADQNPPRHPRLLVDAKQLPALRKKVQTKPFSLMLESIRAEAAEPVDREKLTSVLYDMSIRHHAQVYLLTGEARHAQAARQLALEMIADKRYWQDRGSKGLTRAAGLWSVAMAYDFCHEAWDGPTRRKVSEELLKAAKGLMASMGAGANNNIANNWQGVRYGTALLAGLACDEPGGKQLAEDAYQTLVRHIKANLGSNGWNPEGIGYTIYPATFTAPAGIAAARAGIGDLRKDVPPYTRTFWTTLAGTVPIPTVDGSLGLRADLSDDHPAYNPSGMAGAAFYYAPDEQAGALRWMYDRFVGPRGENSWDCDRWGGGLYSVLYYPTSVEPVNPAKSLGLNFVDKSHGLVIFRDRFQDASDIVAVVNAHSRQPKGCHGGSDTNTIRILGLGGVFAVGSGRTGDTAGQTNLFVGDPPGRGTGGLGELRQVRFDGAGGGATVTEGSCMGVRSHVRRFVADFSGDSGAAAMFVNSDTSLNGGRWRLNTPECNTITTARNSFTITSPVGSSLKVTLLEPRDVTFRTGQFKRGARAVSPFPYRGKSYQNNKWIEFDCDARVAVVMTLQKGEAPDVAVTPCLHGATAKVGKTAVAYEKQTGEVAIGEEAEKMELASRDEPLRPRGLAVRTLSDSSAEIRWLVEDLGAETLVLQRRAGEGDWKDVARLRPGSGKHVDEDLPSGTQYAWRLIAVNSAGQSDPSAEVEGRTWQAGYALHVEDFARSGRADFGTWVLRNEDRGWSHEAGDGSPRNATRKTGYYQTGSVRIGKENILYTEGIRCDLSGESARAQFDVMSQAVTRFGLMLKLADGRWICSGRQYIGSRYKWETVTVGISDSHKWSLCDPRTGRFGKEVDVKPSDLKDIRGVGVWTSWVINQKWARLDQLHLIAKGFRTVEE